MNGRELNNVEIKNPIADDVARMLCREIRAEAEIHWYTAGARLCYACRKSRKDLEKAPGFTDMPGNRGCILVNARYALMLTEGRDFSN